MPGRVVSWRIRTRLGGHRLLLCAGLSCKPWQPLSPKEGVRPLSSPTQVSFREGQEERNFIPILPCVCLYSADSCHGKGKIQEMALIKFFVNHLPVGWQDEAQAPPDIRRAPAHSSPTPKAGAHRQICSCSATTPSKSSDRG